MYRQVSSFRLQNSRRAGKHWTLLATYSVIKFRPTPARYADLFRSTASYPRKSTLLLVELNDLAWKQTKLHSALIHVSCDQILYSVLYLSHIIPHHLLRLLNHFRILTSLSTMTEKAVASFLKEDRGFTDDKIFKTLLPSPVSSITLSLTTLQKTSMRIMTSL